MYKRQVLLLGESENGKELSDNGSSGLEPDTLAYDLQLKYGGLHIRQLARIITHCLYG